MGAERRRSWRSWRLSLAWVGPCLSPIYCGPQFKPGTEGEEGISRGINRLGTCELLLMRTIKPRARCAPPPPCGEGDGGSCDVSQEAPPSFTRATPLPNPPPQGGREQTECGARAFHSRESTHPGEALLLALVERVVEARERGADRGGRGAHGGQALAHRLHAADRGERGLGGAGGGERVGGFERGGDELVEGDALRGREPHVALDLSHRPVAQHGGKRLAAAAPAGLRSGALCGVLARGRLARCGIGAPTIPARGIIAARAPRVLRLAPSRRVHRVARPRRGLRRHPVQLRLLLVVERGVERLERRLDRVQGGQRGGDRLLRRLEPRRRRGGHVARAVGGEALARRFRFAAQRLQRVALIIVGRDGARYVVQRPVRELGRLRRAAAHELVDGGAERAVAAAGERGIAGWCGGAGRRCIVARGIAAAILVAGAAALVAIVTIAPPVAAVAIAPAIIARAVLSEILAAIERTVLPGACRILAAT